MQVMAIVNFDRDDVITWFDFLIILILTIKVPLLTYIE